MRLVFSPLIDPSKQRRRWRITRTAVLLSIAVLCVVALVTPVAANMLLRGETRFNLTDPSALILIGAALISLGMRKR